MSKRKILALLLAVAMICSVFVSPALAAEDAGEPVAISDNAGPLFNDIDGHWAAGAINRWADYGIVKGDGDGAVWPNRTLKRDEVATVLARLLGLKAKAPASTFTDVPADAWYTDAVLQCAAAGIMLGDGIGHANPESTIDRQQTIVMVARALGAKGSDSKSLNSFRDGNTVAGWAAPYLASLADMGILNGLPTDDGYVVVAPASDIDRASLFALLDKAIGQYVTTPTTVTVNDPNKFVVINTDAGEDVTVTGTTAGIVVGAGSADDVILDNATVGTLKVDAPVDVIIKKGSAVTDLDANAAVKVTNNGTVTNLNTNADDVTFDGNKPSKVNTAEDVEPAKDSKGNEVTTAPTTSTGSFTPTNYKYKVSVASVTGGKVTADLPRTNTPGETVTLTVTPDAQKDDTMPYVLKSLSVKCGDGEAQDITETKSFTMNEEGTYTVTAEFVQPITKAAFFIADGVKNKSEDMEAFGYPANNVPNSSLENYPYLFVGLERSTEDYEITDFTITANGTKVEPLPWGAPNHWAATYVNNKVPAIDPAQEGADKLNLLGSAYAFVLTFKINEAEYKFSCNYRDPAKADETFYKVTFLNGDGDTVYEGVTNEEFTVPAAAAVEGKYFTGWTYGETAVATGDKVKLEAAHLTVKANYMEIKPQTTAPRPAGDPNNFNYSAAYDALGLTLKNNTLTVDAAKIITGPIPEALMQTDDDGVVYVFYGVEYTNKPAGATHAVVSYGKTIDFDGEKAVTVAVGATDSSDGGTSAYNGHLIDYLPVAYKENGVWNFFETGDTFTRYIKWLEGDKVRGITKATTTLKVEPATFTVTFKDGDTTEETEVAYNSDNWTLPTMPENSDDIFLGWFDDDDTQVTTPKALTDNLTLTAKWKKAIHLTATEYDFSCPEGDTQYITFTLADKDGQPFYIAASTVSKCEYRKDRNSEGEWAEDTGVKLFDKDIEDDSNFEGMDQEHQLGWTLVRKAENSISYCRFTDKQGNIYVASFVVPKAIDNPDHVIWGDTKVVDKPATAIPVAVTTTPEQTTNSEDTGDDENA